ncbi:helix-turn-helix transcriptional regulator [Luteimonas sp. SJ-92]|uniref:Helix-turn-helix transcriptional regulator n=1 Tax=Luteimonas salinisoli TaxID=2752307 RepID=A0A853J8B4_9GAMM|nr:helix-turn-helix transcriptional regulator [Luteimonas salinisoli]NZA25406.1 helix-turn-helix transcriptional regulator [Luteimonas salinisoli]
MSPFATNAATIEGSLRALGARVAKLRLSRNLTQANVAREAGASVSSVKRLEAGENTSLETLLRVLGVLGLEQRLLESLPDPAVRPVERVRHGGRERQRARQAPEIVPKSTDWAWGEEDA